MTNSVKRKVKVLKADYIKEADSILIVGECSEGRLRHQIHSSTFSFGNRNKEEEMKKTAALMEGKNIYMVFDPDLEGKIQEHVRLKY
jgi:hypothetical protein